MLTIVIHIPTLAPMNSCVNINWSIPPGSPAVCKQTVNNLSPSMSSLCGHWVVTSSRPPWSAGHHHQGNCNGAPTTCWSNGEDEQGPGEGRVTGYLPSVSCWDSEVICLDLSACALGLTSSNTIKQRYILLRDNNRPPFLEVG